MNFSAFGLRRRKLVTKTTTVNATAIQNIDNNLLEIADKWLNSEKSTSCKVWISNQHELGMRATLKTITLKQQHYAWVCDVRRAWGPSVGVRFAGVWSSLLLRQLRQCERGVRSLGRDTTSTSESVVTINRNNSRNTENTGKGNNRDH